MTDLTRDAFEAWYCADAARHGLTFMPAEIARMRDGETYGPGRVAINSKWEGWQARALAAAREREALETIAEIAALEGTDDNISRDDFSRGVRAARLDVGRIVRQTLQGDL